LPPAIPGLALFGVAGVPLAIPVVAMLLTLLDLYRTRNELLPRVLDREARPAPGAPGERPDRAVRED